MNIHYFNRKHFENCIFSANFWWNFFRISRQIPENSDVCRFFNQICENKSEICRKFWILWKKFTIIQNYSLHSLLGTSSRPSAARGEAPAKEAWRLWVIRRFLRRGEAGGQTKKRQTKGWHDPQSRLAIPTCNFVSGRFGSNSWTFPICCEDIWKI